jgi:hypothetical protein
VPSISETRSPISQPIHWRATRFRFSILASPVGSRGGSHNETAAEVQVAIGTDILTPEEMEVDLLADDFWLVCSVN